jgi:hypothetical protein
MRHGSIRSMLSLFLSRGLPVLWDLDRFSGLGERWAFDQEGLLWHRPSRSVGQRDPLSARKSPLPRRMLFANSLACRQIPLRPSSQGHPSSPRQNQDPLGNMDR